MSCKIEVIFGIDFIIDLPSPPPPPALLVVMRLAGLGESNAKI